jgi:hypothetical protein
MARGDLAAAREALTERVQVCRATGRLRSVAWALTELSAVAEMAGDVTSADGLRVEADATFAAVGVQAPQRSRKGPLATLRSSARAIRRPSPADALEEPAS